VHALVRGDLDWSSTGVFSPTLHVAPDTSAHAAGNGTLGDFAGGEVGGEMSSAGASEGAMGHLPVVWGGMKSFGPLGGMMMLSYFIHNCIQPITKAASPKTKRRDVVIAFSVCAIFYMLVGVLGYLGFSAAADHRAPFKSNFLDIFGTTFDTGIEVYAFTARMALCCQLLTVLPLLLLIIRTHFFGLLLNTAWPGFWRVAGLNAGIMAVTYVFAALNLDVSDVVRYTGAIGGILLIFAVPLLIDMRAARQSETGPGCGRWAMHIGIWAVGIGFFVLQFVPVS
jgi:sodium-coupled neutral amino acid transporter 9